VVNFGGESEWDAEGVTGGGSRKILEAGSEDLRRGKK